MEISPYVAGKSKAAPGQKIIKLSSNENPLGPSPRAIEAYKKHAELLFRYPDAAFTELREAIGEVYKLDPARIVCGAGSDELIGLLTHAYAGAGDEVLYPEHGFLMYPIYARSNGATPVTAKEKNLTTDVDALLKAVTPKTKIVFVANPNNPTGTYISAAELKRLREGLPEHVILAVDAAYAEYVEAKDYSNGLELASSTENTVMLRTFSKIYGLSSLRLGWGYFPKAIADVLHRIRGPFNVAGPSIAAGSAAVRDVEYTRKAVEHNNHWLKWLTKELNAIGLSVVPSVANFILVKFPDAASNRPEKTSAKANLFLMERGIIPREVVNYGLPEYLRISIGLEEDNQLLLESLKEFMK